MRYKVLTARALMPASCWGKYGRVAIVECSYNIATKEFNTPKQIHPNHSSVVKIIHTWERLFIGTSDRCAFINAILHAEKIADELNSKQK